MRIGKLTLLMLSCFCLLLGIFQNAGAQEASPEVSKKFRIGLQASPSLNWYKPETKKKLENDGLKPKINWGLTMDYYFAENAGVSFGLRMDYNGAAIDYKVPVYYFYAQDEAYKIEDIVYYQFSGDTLLLQNRRYSVNYITLPLYLKMRTQEIGYLTYFGQFGINSSIRMKTGSKDQVINVRSGSKFELTDVSIKEDISLFREQLVIGLGAEYNLVGTTSVVGSINYCMGLTSVTKRASSYLFTKDDYAKTISPLSQKFTEHCVALSIAILF